MVCKLYSDFVCGWLGRLVRLMCCLGVVGCILAWFCLLGWVFGLWVLGAADWCSLRGCVHFVLGVLGLFVLLLCFVLAPGFWCLIRLLWMV